MALVNDAGLGAITEGCKTSHGGIVLPIGTIARDFAVGESALMGDYESRFSVLRSVPSTVEEYKALMLKGKKKVKAGQSNCVSVVAC